MRHFCMKNSKVTIAIPYYNSSIYLLRKCLDSCLNQTYDNINILVMVDGTPRDISDVVKSYSSNKKVKFVISEKNLGVSAERNLAIKSATGDYLLFIDSDDYIDSQMVEEMVGRIERDNSDIAICGIIGTNYDCEDGVFDKKVFFSFPTRFCHIQYTNFVANKMFKLSVIRDNNISFDESVKLGEDALFCQEYYKYSKIISCIYNRFYHYIMQNTSSTKKYDPNFYKYEKRVIGEIENNFKINQLNDQEKQYMQHWHYRKVYMAYNHYYLAYRDGRASKKEILDKYDEMLGEDIFNVDTQKIGSNQFYKKGERRTAKNFKKNANHVFWNMSLAHGKRATLRAIFS